MTGRIIKNYNALFANYQNKKTKTASDNWYNELLDAIADLAWWYGWSSDEIDMLDIDDFDRWLNQLSRQAKAGYARA
ncbi:GpE family phage tail protein [uncultured Moraxella sp.]|uniref:GpE family phage tail protein n=1 Tax=uncultured Moraxella sp. TaxID=263769 RepID=UPI0025CC15D5|nr:GpE family phage tail protein [uncultured Moraxella sp.]